MDASLAAIRKGPNCLKISSVGISSRFLGVPNLGQGGGYGGSGGLHPNGNRLESNEEAQEKLYDQLSTGGVMTAFDNE